MKDPRRHTIIKHMLILSKKEFSQNVESLKEYSTGLRQCSCGYVPSGPTWKSRDDCEEAESPRFGT